MLRKIFIQNFVIIDKLDISFGSEMNVITGETGAGKSILMDALNLLLGQRADSAMLLQQDQKCIIEGLFDLKAHSEINDFLNANDLDSADELVIRREITSNGKSRGFINDTPVNVSQLKQLGTWLVDLHQQFDHLEINSNSFQREVIDAVAGNHALLKSLQQDFKNYTKIRDEWSHLKSEQEKGLRELDYNRHLFEELEQMNLKNGELEEIDATLKMLNNAEAFKSQLSVVYLTLSADEKPILPQLKSLVNTLRSIEKFHPDLALLSERMHAAYVELSDISEDLERIASKVTADPEKMNILNDRLSEGYKLMKKHGVQTTDALIQIMNDLSTRLHDLSHLEIRISELGQQMQIAHTSCIKIASQLSSNRKASLDGFAKKVNQLLHQVGMPNARLRIQLADVPLSIFGTDQVEFLFDANKRDKFEPLHKVASGGELSRLMLCVKSLVAKKLEMPTMIFDEIDTGISGEAAKQVGVLLRELSTAHQLITITHQAQIAAKASAHFFIYKEVFENRVRTNVRMLNMDERITAIASMLSGEKPTAAAIQNAREMVSN